MKNSLLKLFVFILLISTFILPSSVSAVELFQKKIDFSGTDNGSNPMSSLTQATDSMLYGTTYSGGVNNKGILFQYNPTTGILTKKIDFSGADNGANPRMSLVQATDGMLYGMTYSGGANDFGILFQYNPTTGILTKKIDFSGTDNGANPMGSLTQATDEMLYGLTNAGGVNDSGIIFQYNPTTGILTKKIDFTSDNGASPLGSLTQALDGMLYGTTIYGGINDTGILFQYNPTTGILTKKIDFTSDNGENPNGSIVQASDSMLYGMTQVGGTNNKGVIFQYNPTTGILTKKIDFIVSNGSYPMGSLAQASDSMLYGMTQSGGINDTGILFQYNPTTGILTKKIDFSGTDNGANPMGSLTQATDEMLYGLTSQGGNNNFGILFQYNLNLHPLSLPSVITYVPTSLTQTSTTLNANISSTGGASVTERGFDYGLTTSYGANIKDTGTFETGTYSKDILYLTCNTVYHYRAYVTNSVGTTYSDDQNFTTSDCPHSSGSGGYFSFKTTVVVPTVTPTTSITQIVLTKTLKLTTQRMMGDDVKELQNYLIIHKYLNGTADGVFGVLTSNAVKEFQKLNNLTPDGTVGPKTLKYLNDVNTVVAPTTVPSVIPVVVNQTITDRTLRLNMRGDDVRKIQRYLNTHGYVVSKTGLGSFGHETIYFQPQTEAAVKEFQTANNLTPDGVVGLKTRELMK